MQILLFMANSNATLDFRNPFSSLRKKTFFSVDHNLEVTIVTLPLMAGVIA